MSKIRVSEMFASMQGEGRFTGKPSLWIRLFGCNLQCNGFGQKDPTDPSTYDLPYRTIDLSNIKTMSDLPVFDKGCDSGYSWSPRFRNLAQLLSADEIVDRLIDLGKSGLGVDLINDRWLHPVSNVISQLCFTGGEPMMQQRAMYEIIMALGYRNLSPPMVTIETNATQVLDDRYDFQSDFQSAIGHLHMSCSPKLFSTSGECGAINPTVIESYVNYSDSGVLKFVVDGTQRTWDELDNVMLSLNPIIRNHSWDVWIMPVNSTIETQTPQHIGAIASEALKRGYAVSVRVHVHAFGNCIGT